MNQGEGSNHYSILQTFSVGLQFFKIELVKYFKNEEMLELTNELSKITEYKISIYKLVAFLYTN